ncbi:cupin domain-containing protein [Puia sp.]|jgi:quercetin dioxygenase-like cupin family protein|uniref:cupin domain-containing protein n=1 Tax=Puia sp. TaxID=2045100 RepID=UPI002F4196BA
MKKHKNILASLLFTGVIGLGLAAIPNGVQAQQPGLKRVDLQRHDLSAPGWEAIQVRVDFGPGVVAPRHRHPGEEIIYVLRGSIEYQVEGKPPVTLKTGDVLFVPAGAIHSAKNVGRDEASELATYIVEKGKPLVEPVK